MNRMKKSIILSLSLVSAGLLLLFHGMAVGYVWWNAKGNLEKEEMNAAFVHAEVTRQNVRYIDFGAIDTEVFPETEWYQEFLGVISRESSESTFLSECLVYLGDGNGVILLSEQEEYMTEIRKVYPASVITALWKRENVTAAVTGTDVESGSKYGFVIMPMEEKITPGFYLVTSVPLEHEKLMEKKKLLFYRYLLLGSIFFLTEWGILITAFYHWLRPVRRLAKKMTEAAKGMPVSFELSKTKIPNNELGRMWIAFQKLYQAWKHGSHQERAMTKAYARFVPEAVEQLFFKDSITDVHRGDVIRLSGILGMISLAAAKPEGKPETEALVQEWNGFLEIIHQENKKAGGILLPESGGIEEINVYYEDELQNYGKAVRAGILAYHRWWEKECHKKWLKPTLLLHRSEFFYGLTGTGEKMFPFLESKELECWNPILTQLKIHEVSFVITERIRKNLEADIPMRYIGRVSPGNNSDSWKLYEILEACTDKEKTLKQKTDSDFQKGLELFYQKDFYLARNYFTEVLKENENDKIAVWYVFRSESFFHNQGTESLTFDLF